jgi:regulator of protease activity HflC (stomatin/prohibitin superfamily)
VFFFILFIFFVVITIGVAVVGARTRKEASPVEGFSPAWAFIPGVIAVIFLIFSTVYTQSVGQSKVILNLGGTIAGQDTSAGIGFHAPWQNLSTWDTFAQQLNFAGNATDGKPKYVSGDLNGYEITSSVARGAQTNIDLQVTYNLDPAKVTDLYKQFRNQDRFTKQVVEPKVLAVVRTVPTSYTPVEFRGDKRGEATQRILAGLNDALNSYGITVSQVNLQSIRYTDTVEDSIKAVEVAQQKEAEAQANLRAATVEAQTRVVQAQAGADAARAEAQGQADANELLTKSLTDKVLQQRYIDALKAGTVFVVPEGSSPLVNIPAAPAGK